jgi:hypothetical protein
VSFEVVENGLWSLEVGRRVRKVVIEGRWTARSRWVRWLTAMLVYFSRWKLSGLDAGDGSIISTSLWRTSSHSSHLDSRLFGAVTCTTNDLDFASDMQAFGTVHMRRLFAVQLSATRGEIHRNP